MYMVFILETGITLLP